MSVDRPQNHLASTRDNASYFKLIMKIGDTVYTVEKTFVHTHEVVSFDSQKAALWWPRYKRMIFVSISNLYHIEAAERIAKGYREL